MHSIGRHFHRSRRLPRKVNRRDRFVAIEMTSRIIEFRLMGQAPKKHFHTNFYRETGNPRCSLLMGFPVKLRAKISLSEAKVLSKCLYICTLSVLYPCPYLICSLARHYILFHSYPQSNLSLSRALCSLASLYPDKYHICSRIIQRAEQAAVLGCGR